MISNKSTIKKSTDWGMRFRRWRKPGQFKPLPSYAEQLAKAIAKEEAEETLNRLK